jgi:hypothetical protein
MVYKTPLASVLVYVLVKVVGAEREEAEEMDDDGIKEEDDSTTADEAPELAGAADLDL